MKNNIFFSGTFIIVNLLSAQQNCELLKDDPDCYRACQLYNKESMHYQGSYASQKHLSDAIELCPTLSNAYFEKSVGFLKRGMFVEWKELMDKAVELNPEQHLPYRAWCQFSFLRNYEEAIEDLNKLAEIKGTPFIGVGQNGDYDLRMVLALCYRFTDQAQKAIETIETAMSDANYYVGLYDYLHLGVLYLKNDQLDKAEDSFEKQIEENDISEAFFYLGSTMRKQGKIDEANINLNKALEYYEKGRKMNNNYYQLPDQIYKQDIIDLMNSK